MKPSGVRRNPHEVRLKLCHDEHAAEMRRLLRGVMSYALQHHRELDGCKPVGMSAKEALMELEAMLRDAVGLE